MSPVPTMVWAAGIEPGMLNNNYIEVGEGKGGGRKVAVVNIRYCLGEVKENGGCIMHM